MQITIEDAYAEACKALGETVIRERFLLSEVERLSHMEQHGPQQASETD